MNANAATCAAQTPGETQAAAAQAAAPDFDRLAPIYRWMEWASFGPFLWWCRCAFLREMRGRRRALVIGDGDGRFTARLLRTNERVRVDAVDASPAMLRALERRARRHEARVRTTCADARCWQPQVGAAYDLVVTHFFLDCLTTEEVRSLAARVRLAAAPGAVWAVSEFAVPDGWYGRMLAAPLISALYRSFHWLTGLSVKRLPDYARILRDSGFRLENRRAWLGGLLVSELWAANRNVNAMLKSNL